MNKTFHLRRLLPLLPAVVLCLAGCQDSWENHYGEQTWESVEGLELYDRTTAEFMQTTAEFSAEYKLLQEAGIFDRMTPGSDYTLLLYPNDIFANSSMASDKDYASYCISDVALSPAKFKNGLGINTWYGKNIWISGGPEGYLIDGHAYSRAIRTKDACLYVITDAVIGIRHSIYDELKALPDERYSKFKELVFSYERSYFDASKCTPAGTNKEGNTIYSDSVNGWLTKNILMDRYTEEGQELWNMRSEDYNSTVFIPSNDLIEATIDTALSRIPKWLGRKATQADREKFEKWIVRACFVDKPLTAGQVTGTEDIDCVGGYLKDTIDDDKFTASTYTMWRPTVQKVRTSDVISASNGKLYFIDWMKIPNNVVIYRLKARFYELWDNMTQQEKDTYFRWDHWIDPMIGRDAQSSMSISPLLPTMYYHVLMAIPDKEARRDSLVCSVNYDGVLYVENNPRGSQIKKCWIPAGEYYLRMGFKHSLLYSLTIQFNDTVLIKDMVMYAQGSNYHFDRGSVSVEDQYGESSVGYPEDFVWRDWVPYTDQKPWAYDTDGFQVGIVNVKEDGYFTFTISSSDMSYLYDYNADRTTSNVKQLMMYHWCLRPTKNNY